MWNVVIYGDSISTRSHGGGGYQELVRRQLGLESVVNHAVSGSGLTAVTPHSLISILEKGDVPAADVDGILIWHGTNDWYWGAELGEPGDGRKDTFWGGVDFTVNTLKKHCPGGKILWPGPIGRWETPDGCLEIGDGWSLANKRGYTQKDYFEALQKAGELYGFAVPDMRLLTGIDSRKAYEELLEDGAHPNRQGYEKIGVVLSRELKQLLENL